MTFDQLTRLRAIEDEVLRIVGPWPDEALAVLFLFLRARGWDTDRALAAKRKGFGE